MFRVCLCAASVALALTLGGPAQAYPPDDPYGGYPNPYGGYPNPYRFSTGRREGRQTSGAHATSANEGDCYETLTRKNAHRRAAGRGIPGGLGYGSYRPRPG